MCNVTPPAQSELRPVQPPREARTWVEENLCSAHAADAEVAAMLLVGELVTHAELTGAGPHSVAVECAVTQLVITVRAGLPRPDARRGDEGRMQLLMVEKVSREWGMHDRPEGRTYWCTLPTGVVPNGRPRRPGLHLSGSGLA